MQLARRVVSDAIFHGHQQRVHVLKALELALVDVLDDPPAEIQSTRNA